MSEANVETVRRGYEAFNQGDLETLLAAVGDDVVWHDAPEVPGAMMHVGRDEVRAFLASFPRVWDEPRFDIREAHVSGDTVVAFARFSGRGRQSGVDVGLDLAHVFRFREGKVLRVVTHLNRENALAALDDGAGGSGDAGGK